MNILLTAKRIESIIDDDEFLSSFCVWFSEGGYLAFARETGSDEIEVEYLDQVNCFLTNSVMYEFVEGCIIFLIKDGNFFDKKNIAEITVDLSKGQFNIPDVTKCLDSIFIG